MRGRRGPSFKDGKTGATMDTGEGKGARKREAATKWQEATWCQTYDMKRLHVSSECSEWSDSNLKEYSQ